MLKDIISTLVVGCTIYLLVFLGVCSIICLMWNTFVVSIFGLPTITLWQAIILKILFGLFQYENNEIKKE